jgi:hypothetical protein
MGATGIKECEENLEKKQKRSTRLVNLAKDMIDVSKYFTWGPHKIPLKLKIGIHKGKVMAGVIGNPKP